MRLLTVLCLMIVPALLGGCEDDQVTIRVMIPDVQGRETPVAGVRLFFFPYDRDSALRELEHLAPTPRPDTARLDSLLGTFRGPFVRFVSLGAQRERLSQERDSLDNRLALLPVDAPERPALTTALKERHDALLQLEPDLERARVELDAVRHVLPEAESLRTTLAVWEDSAHRGIDSLNRILVRRTRRDPIVESTGPAGWVTIALEPGDWWVVARAVNVLDPNAQWVWNLRITTDTTILNPQNGQSQPRR